MARPLRVEFEGALYHLTARGNGRQIIFADDDDCTCFMQILGLGLKRFDVELHGFVLMKNHFHLLAQTRRANLSRWMHWLLVTYTVYFQRRHRRVGEGHLFQGRFKSILVEAEGYLLTLSRYIHLNPVRGARLGRGELAERRQRLRAWRWSSYRSYAGLAETPAVLSETAVLGEMSRSLPARASMAECRRSYRQFVEEGLIDGKASPWEVLQAQSILGSESFLQTIKDRVAQSKERLQRRNEITPIRRLMKSARGTHDGSAEEAIPPAKVIAYVAHLYRLDAREMTAAKSQRGWCEGRGVAMVLIRHLCGLTYRQIGELFEGMAYPAVAQRIQRVEQRNRGKRLRFSLERLTRTMSRMS
jgi:REP element-mobilizing transposase RayT